MRYLQVEHERSHELALLLFHLAFQLEDDGECILAGVSFDLREEMREEIRHDEMI